MVKFSFSCTHLHKGKWGLLRCVKIVRVCSGACVCLCSHMSVYTKHTSTTTVNCLKFAVMVTYTEVRGKDDT